MASSFLLRHAALTTLLLLTPAVSACSKPTRQTTPADAGHTRTTPDGLSTPRNDVPGLKNLARVDRGLWRSAQPRREGFRQLKRLGVKTVVSLRLTRSDRKYLKGLGLRYKRLPIRPWKAKVEQLLKLLRILSDPQLQPVHVHCKHGADRTGLVVALYQVVVQGWSKARALRELPRFRFHKVWRNLKSTLKRIDVEDFKKRLKTTPAPPLELVP